MAHVLLPSSFFEGGTHGDPPGLLLTLLSEMTPVGLGYAQTWISCVQDKKHPPHPLYSCLSHISFLPSHFLLKTLARLNPILHLSTV